MKNYQYSTLDDKELLYIFFRRLLSYERCRKEKSNAIRCK